MSSTYRLICLSHDPALVIEDREWHNRESAEAALDRDSTVEDHPDCELLIGRFSYPLIEVCCPPLRGCRAVHSSHHWADVDWLRLLLAAHEAPAHQPLMAAIKPLSRRCWTYQRLTRLRAHLGGDLSRSSGSPPDSSSSPWVNLTTVASYVVDGKRYHPADVQIVLWEDK